jgi:hypothetical protein
VVEDTWSNSQQNCGIRARDREREILVENPEAGSGIPILSLTSKNPRNKGKEGAWAHPVCARNGKRQDLRIHLRAEEAPQQLRLQSWFPGDSLSGGLAREG